MEHDGKSTCEGLLPCPCCGSSDVAYTYLEPYKAERLDRSFVICNGCGMVACNQDTYPHDCRKVWNTRLNA